MTSISRREALRRLSTGGAAFALPGVTLRLPRAEPIIVAGHAAELTVAVLRFGTSERILLGSARGLGSQAANVVLTVK